MKILTSRTSLPSSRLLGSCLEDEIGKRVIITLNPDRINSCPFIRYGNSAECIVETEFNPIEFIHLCSSKLAFSALLRENGFYTPEFFKQETPQEFPVLIRQSLNASGGRGIILCESENDFGVNWRSNYYWTPFVKTEFELRVHILGGKVDKIFKKVCNGDEEPFPIRNLHKGYHFSLKNSGNYKKVMELVERLLNIGDVASGKFYSLDLGWDPQRREYIIFEANSGSGLNSQTAISYAKFLAEDMDL